MGIEPINLLLYQSFEETFIAWLSLADTLTKLGAGRESRTPHYLFGRQLGAPCRNLPALNLVVMERVELSLCSVWSCCTTIMLHYHIETHWPQTSNYHVRFSWLLNITMCFNMVRKERLELSSLSAMASKTIVYTIPPLTHFWLRPRVTLPLRHWLMRPSGVYHKSQNFGSASGIRTQLVID